MLEKKMNQEISISLDAFSDQTRSAILALISAAPLIEQDISDLDHDDDINEIKDLLAEFDEFDEFDY